MDYKQYLKSQIEVGYSKTDLEKLIGLPKNFLSGFLSDKKKLSIKGKLKVDRWLNLLEKPSPLDVSLYLSTLINKEIIPEKPFEKIPKNLEELRAMCPKGLSVLERAAWMAEKRIPLNI